MLWLLAPLPSAATADVRTVVLPDEVRGKPIVVSCRVAQATRIVFPERSKRLKVGPGAKDLLGIRFVATRPRAAPSEVRLAFPDAPAPAKVVPPASPRPSTAVRPRPLDLVIGDRWGTPSAVDQTGYPVTSAPQ